MRLTLIILASCFVLFIGAAIVGYALNWLFSPSFRRTETEDAARTGATFHAAAWGATLLIVFAVIAAGLAVFSALLPGD